MNSSVAASEKNEKAMDRIISFSDSVFGFAITLLVMGLLEIPRPELNENFIESFFRHWQELLAFLVGFLTIFVCWLNHHHMYGYITRYNSSLLWINGFLLLIITFTPMPTAILAEFLDKENHIGIIFFGFTYFFIATFYYLTWSYAFNNKLVNEDMDERYFQCIKLTYQYASIYTFITFWVCFLSTPLAIIMYGLMFIVFAFPKAFARQLQKMKYNS